MPALPSKVIRRRTATPTTKLHKDDVWQRTLDIMGLEPLSASTNPSIASPTTGDMAEPTAAPASSSMKITILDLPSETQKEIFRHASSTDLIALSLVSKHFRDIAAEHLYRSFHIVFPDEDDPANDSPIDGLAGGLDTFVTSEYDYAKYLRAIVLETLSPADKGERAYRHYTYDVSCGKFMNTLLLLTLRKAKSLETFRWDIRVELSRQVFKALHQIQALQHLHLRIQVGPSIYQAPPALPASSILNGMPPGPPPPPGHPHTVLLPMPPAPPSWQGSSSPNSFSAGSKLSSKVHQKNVKALLPTVKAIPPTLSGFKNLKTLSILDMDTHEYVREIKTCIQHSSSTLHTLKLSFSESLASKSRKPPPEVQSDDDSDQEDEFGQLIPPGPPPPSAGASDPNGPSKVFKAQEEKKKQEAVLEKIFGMEAKPRKPIGFTNAIPVKDEAETKPEDDPKRRFIRNLAPVAARLMAHVKPGSDLTTEGKETLALIERAAKLYMDTTEKGKSKATGSAGSSTAKATPASSSASMDGGAEDEVVMSGAASIPDGPGLFDEPEKKKVVNTDSGVSNPEDIDIEEPEGQELAVEDETLAEPTPSEATRESNIPSSTSDGKPENTADTPGFGPAETMYPHIKPPAVVDFDPDSWENKLRILDDAIAIRASHDEILKESTNLKKRLVELKMKFQSGQINEADKDALAAAEAEFHVVAGQVELLSHHMQKIDEQWEVMKDNDKALKELAQPKDEGAKMSEYVRNTRGLTLTTLAIYLIPIKASVLSKAIDLSVLRSITLLNVGPQIPFWNLMARENKMSPLPLRKVHTDNVTLQFLAFVAQLDTLNELYLLERTAKARVESTAAKTMVTMEQIRRVILKKHASTLKVLMIRNDAGSEWDLNVKTTVLLCQRAKQLEELACSFGIRTMHSLFQFMPGLTSLRVLHTIQFRTDDTCMWVMREFRKFAVDNISHNPDMKLEYLALDSSVERLVRRTLSKSKTDKKDKKGKGKGNENVPLLAELVYGPTGVWPDGSGIGGGGSMAGLGFDWQDSEDEDEMIAGGKMGLRIETVDGVRFCDIAGVKVFEKEILGGRL